MKSAAGVFHGVALGRIPYEEGLAAQVRVVAARQKGLIGDTVLLMEHEPVLTLGRNSTRANILATHDFLTRRGISVHEVNRGGDVTYHGPGQLVGYPVFDLRGDLPGRRGPHLGPVDFMRLLEEVLIRTCSEFRVPAQRIPKRTGVWTFAGGAQSERKISALGIHVARGVTSHGFALNVSTDLRDFAWIVPCGIADRGVTSLEQEADVTSEPTMDRAVNLVVKSFGHVFGRQIVFAGSLDELLAEAPAQAPST